MPANSFRVVDILGPKVIRSKKLTKNLNKKKGPTYLITGGCGFIGSNIAAALANRGARVIISDRFRSGIKWRNLEGVTIYDIVPPEDLTDWLNEHAKILDGVIHMGAISATTERDADKIIKNNFLLSCELWEFATKHGLPFIYASSAATYGGGENGFDDDQSQEALAHLRPLNPYGWSKLIFDQRILSDISMKLPQPPQWAGLKFFNVYGPNETHKDDMRSVINKVFPLVRDGEKVSLFKSHNPEYPDGGQLRDFVYVKDCVKIVLWLLDHRKVSGIFNVGTGEPRSFYDLVAGVGKALQKNPKIDYIDMPEQIRNSYQYFTQANIQKLRQAGYRDAFYSLEDGIADYVECDLIKTV